MHEIFIIESEDWELSILCQEQVDRYRALDETLRRRNKGTHGSTTQVRLSRQLNLEIQQPKDVRNLELGWTHCSSTVDTIQLEAPLLFDNTQYHFHWVFKENKNISWASIKHRLRRLQDSFAFKSKPPMLLGTINTGNDIGWLRLPLAYEKEGKEITLTLSFEVFSTKLDTREDLQYMYRCIDEEFPLWRFKFARSTEQTMSRSRHRGYFPIMWLAQFQSLRFKLFAGLKVIVNSPHNRLHNYTRYINADKIKGKIDHKTAERVISDLASGTNKSRYSRTSKRLSADTPENRFIKMVVTRTAKTLGNLHQNLHEQSKTPEKQLLSDSFLNELLEWQRSLKHVSSRTFLAEIGNYSELSSESQVLHQQAGYSSVYRVWQELRFYLDLFEAQALISMRSIDEIYEIWCFLEVRKTLMVDLGFKEVKRDSIALRRRGLEVELKDGMTGSFEFKRQDGTHIQLAHEPIFKKKASGNGINRQSIRTYWLTQKPDIFLQATFADNRQCIWLFDAKYRVDQASWESEDETGSPDKSPASCKRTIGDLVPEDALNQMHRYRDALIREDEQTGEGNSVKSRPVFGAYALYPGFFDQRSSKNPYEDVIHEVGIGAFSLLPSDDGKAGRLWLSNFLKSQLVNSQISESSTKSSSDHLFMKEPPRIPYRGMAQKLHRNLVMVAGLGKDRSKAYQNGFRDGTANWYHCPVKSFDARYIKHLTGELEYLAIASLVSGEKTTSIIHVWQIIGVDEVARENISEQQAGARCRPEKSKSPYWLFELGAPLKLSKPVPGFPRTNFINSLRITTLSRLSNVTHYNELEDVYGQAVSKP